MSVAVLNFSRLPILDRITKTRLVVIDMTDNANYATPDPTLAAITDSAKLLEDNLITANSGGAAQTTILNLQNKAHLKLMMKLLLYIQMASGGDQQKIESTGLKIRKRRSAAEKMAKVTQLKGKVGLFAGDTLLSWKKLEKAKFYYIQISNDGKTGWLGSGEPVTKRTAKISGLVPETGSFFRVAAGNGLGIGAYSDAVRVMAM